METSAKTGQNVELSFLAVARYVFYFLILMIHIKSISLNLNGKINIWNQDTLENEKLPDLILTGHQNSVYHVRYSKQMKKIISCDFNGIFGK